MTLPTSGPISLSAIANNNSSASLSNLSLRTESIRFASASIVGDVDGNGTGNLAADRVALNTAPHALSEFRGANFPSSIITGITFTTAGGTDTVDGEDLDVAFTTNGQAGTYTVRLIDSSGNTDASTTRSGAGTVTFSTLSLTEDTYRPQVEFNTFNVVNDDQTFTHHDALSGGSTSLTNATQTVDAADESVSNVQITAAVSSGTQEGFKVAQSVVVGGDGGNITSNVNTSATHTSPQTVTISNPPGQLRFTTTHIGDPSEARNSVSSTADVTITYNRAIDGVGTLDTSNAGKTQFNSGDTIRVFAVSEGVQGVTMKMGYGTANNDTTYTSDDNKSISDSRFVRSSQTFDTSRTLTSGTSLETFFPKANYTSGTSALSAGSSFSVAPAFSYNTPGDTTINVNQTRALDISSIVGNNVSVAITSSPDKGSGTNTATLSPGTLNDVYTITYTGTANFSQTSNQTDTITVNPTVSVAKSAATGNPTADTDGVSISSTSHGISPTTFTFTPTAVGTSLGFTYSMASGFSFTSGNANTAGAIQGTFNSAGSKSNSLQVASNGTSATDGFSVTLDSITKDFRAGLTTEALNDSGFRAGGTVDVSDLRVDFVKRARLERQLSDGSFEAVTGTTTVSHGGGLNQNGDTTFTILSNATIDTVRRAVRVVDVDRTANTIDLPNNLTASNTFNMLAPEAVINSFSANVPGTIGRITLSWNVSNAKSNGIVIKRSTASNMSGASTILTTSTAAGSFNDDGLAGDTPFYYQLTATNASNDSVNSSIVNATTPLDTSFSNVPTLSIPFKPGTTMISDVFFITLTQGTGNTTIALDNNVSDDLKEAQILVAASTSDSTPSSFSELNAAGNGGQSTVSVAHTTGNLFMAFKVNDNAGDMEGGADDSFNLVITNNSITSNPSGVFREHEASSTDSSLSQTFQEGSSQLSNATTFLSDNMQISISGCTVGDIVTFKCDRTNGIGDLGDITVKFAVYESDGASTAAYDNSGNLKSGALESAAITSTATGQTVSGITLGSSGLARFRARFKAQSDGTLNATGPFEEDATFRLKVEVENSSGTTIDNPTLYTYTVAANPFS